MKMLLYFLQTNKIVLLFFLTIFAHYVGAQFTLNGDAFQDNNCPNCYILTPNTLSQIGSAWQNSQISLNNSFDYSFKIYLGNNTAGADGIAFVLQNTGNTAIGNGNAELGYVGVAPSVGITIDTYQNAGYGDPSFTSISIQLNGDVSHFSANNIAGPVSALANGTDIEDGNYHVLRITWDGVTHLLSAYIDGDLRVDATTDLVNTVFAGNSMVFFGFTGGTGGASNLQKFCLLTDTAQHIICLCNNGTYTLPSGQIVDDVGDYYYTPTTPISVCQGVIKTTLTAPNVNFTAGNNQTICKETTAQLQADAGTADVLSYAWSPAGTLNDANITNPIATPTTTTNYIVSAQIQTADNLVVNGDFEAGNTGFSSQYILATVNTNPTTALWNAGSGNYVVANGVVSIPNTWWTNCADHTTGTGNMLFADGAVVPNGGNEPSLWCQTIQVTPNTDYAFSTWFTNISANLNTSQLGFFINGIQVGSTQTTPAGACIWNQFHEIWNSGNNTMVDICIAELSGGHAGNDFALDDISFYQICTFIDTVKVTVDSLPEADFSFAGTCFGENTQFTDNSTQANGGNIVDWDWDFGDGNGTANSQNPTYNYNNGGTYNASLTVTDSLGCTDNITKQIIINPSPVVDAGIDVSICVGDSVQLNASGGNTYAWAPNSTITNVGIANPRVFPSNTSNYYVTGTDANACTNTDSVSVTVNTLPTIVSSNDTSVCAGNCLQLSVSGAVTYTWSAGATLSDSSVSKPMACPNNNTTYTIIGTDANGCTNADSVAVVVNIPPTIVSSNDTSICVGNCIQLSVSGAVTYAWSADATLSDTSISNPTACPNNNKTYTVTGTDVDGCTNIAQVNVFVNPLPNVFAGNDMIATCEKTPITLTASGAGTYTWDNGVTNGVAFTQNVDSQTYIVMGTDVNGCVGTDSIQITLKGVMATFTAENLDGCIPLEVKFTNTSTTTGTCQYIIENTTTLAQCNPTITFNQVGCFDITFILSGNNGCADTITKNDLICTEAAPEADFTLLPTTISYLASEVNFINTTSNSQNYVWDFGDGLSSIATNPSHEYDLEGLKKANKNSVMVTLIATTDFGCTDTSVKVIYIKEDLIFYVPNTFTPDGNQFNETFKPIFTSGFDPYNFTLLVYNRWGELLFESHNAAKGWSETYGGKVVPDGVYIWKITFKSSNSDEKITKIGHINVLR